MIDINDRVIDARGLTKKFGEFTAVDGIHFSVQKGEIFGLVGPNGSGKTTTIRMMLGLLQPTSGEVNVLGVPVQSQPERIRPRVGYMSQRFSLYNDLTVLENLRFYGRSYGLRRTLLKDRIQEALELSGLVGRERLLTRELSGGWRQRLALSAAILHRPELVLLDEPTAGVDPLSRRAFWELLYGLVSQGSSVFVTTHYMDEAEHCHRLAFIRHGRISVLGSPALVKKKVVRNPVLELTPDDPARALRILRRARESQRFPLEDVSLYGQTVHVVIREPEIYARDLFAELKKAGVAPGKASLIEPTLEDVFIASMK